MSNELVEKYPQKVPNRWDEREKLRAKGQFWTPAWISHAMAAYALGDAATLFDPAVGAGAFFRAARELEPQLGRRIQLRGCEIDPGALKEASRAGLTASDLAGVRIGDFVLSPPAERFDAIVANPPYVRHHRLSGPAKAALRNLAASLVGETLDGRAGLHVYFLIRALSLLREGGRLAFIVPADTCEGVFAERLWRWIGGRFRVDAVAGFAPEATPFPGVDTNPLVLFIRRAPPRDEFQWALCREAGTHALKRWVSSGFELADMPGLLVKTRKLERALRLGLSRDFDGESAGDLTLKDFACVMRGIATGANGFFHLTRNQARTLGIPEDFLVPAVGRTRDLEGDLITDQTLRQLDAAGRPTLLFSPDGREIGKFPAAVRRYLEDGEAAGLPGRPLIAQRRPWYKMETRRPPAFLFAYLGRRNVRFVRNAAGVIPLTGFLCVYPKQDPDPAFAEKLWRLLSHPRTVGALRLVGKTYGGGAIKVEPRGLERLPLAEDLVAEADLSPPESMGPQMSLFGRRGPEAVVDPGGAAASTRGG